MPIRIGARGWAICMTDRAALIDAYLQQSDWADWQVEQLAGDASGRRYLRLRSGNQSVILMDAPPESGEDTRPFARIADWLSGVGLAPPRILAHDPEQGIMVLSDLGALDFPRWISRHPQDEVPIYRAAADVLVHLGKQAPPAALIHMAPVVAGEMVAITGPHYARHDIPDLCAEVTAHFAEHAPNPNILALRDYHAENLMWRADQEGLARVGLLDFQDAFIAPEGYDLASLLRDVRRDVDQSLADKMTAYYIEKTGRDATFRVQLSCLGAQRNLRILGVFARLARVRGKPHYVDLIPRVWTNLMRDLDHPALTQLRQATLDCLPEPDAALRDRLRA